MSATGFTGTYVEANPLSPATLRQVRTVVEAGGAVLVDAGVVGPPPRPDHPTHLYLAGDADRVAAVQAVFAGTGVTTVVVGSEVGQASAAKQAYALFNKGRVVLAALADRLAEAHGVRHVLVAEGQRPDAELLRELDEVRDGPDPGRLAVGAGDGRDRADPDRGRARPDGRRRPRRRAAPTGPLTGVPPGFGSSSRRG